MHRTAYFLLGLILMVSGCNDVHTVIDDQQIDGTLHYYSQLKSGDRLSIEKGTDLNATFSLEHHPAEGTADGDHGIDGYLTFAFPGLLQEGDSLRLGGKDVQLALVSWGSPHAYNIIDTTRTLGWIHIVEDDLPRKLKTRIDVTFFHNDVEYHYKKPLLLKLANPWVELEPLDTIVLDDWVHDRGYPTDSLSKATLDGIWEAHTATQMKNGKLLRLMWTESPYWMVVKDGRMKTSDWETYHDFDVEGNKITGPEPGYINYVATEDERVVITWLVGEEYVAREYTRKYPE